MKSSFTTHIYARSSKANSSGHYPIYVRITVNGQRTEFSTKKYIDPKKWDNTLSKIKGNTEEARTINSYLELVKSKLNQTQIFLAHTQAEFTLNDFLIAYNGKDNSRQRSIITIFQEHNKRVKALLGKEYAVGTYERYETSLKHTQDFIKYQYKTIDYPLDKIDHAFIMDYDFYLRSIRNCSNNTTIKYLKNFKKIIRICIANGWIDKDPFLNYKSKQTEVERNVLSQDELDRILKKEFEVERLALVRDIFIFSCYTGLAYIDVKNLSQDNIVNGIDGNLWIDTNRQKTDTSSKIPLLEIPLKIIEKYTDYPQALNQNRLIPILSNQKMNAYLKEIADVCRIKKELSFHCARHTFATTVTLSNGVPIESVSKMLGHKSIRTTQHYAKITDRKVANDMDLLRQVIDNKNIIKHKSG